MTRPKYRTAVLGDGKGYRPGVGTILPKLVRDQIRCYVCLNGASVTARGFLRAHPDLDGVPCVNRAPDPAEHHVDDLPPVNIHQSQPPARKPSTVWDEPPREQSTNGSLAYRTGSCIDCGKWVPGERTLCGQCGRKREEERRRR